MATVHGTVYRAEGWSGVGPVRGCDCGHCTLNSIIQGGGIGVGLVQLLAVIVATVSVCTLDSATIAYALSLSKRKWHMLLAR